MGDPKKIRKKYRTPIHPWQKSRIDEEKVLTKNYGLKNKKEVWKSESILRGFRNQVKNLITATSKQAKKEEKQLLDKLSKLNLIKPGSKIDDVLNLNMGNILDRRLQSLVFKQGLARSPKQARQFIVHGHILVKGSKVDVPSYLVNAEEEGQISFNPKSSLSELEHPERIKERPLEKLHKEREKEEKKKEKVPKVEELAKKKEEKEVEEKPKKEKKVKVELNTYEEYKKKKELTTEKLLKNSEEK